MRTKIIALLATGLLLMSLVGPAFAADPRVEICHNYGDGKFERTISVAPDAVADHVADHGDDDFACGS